MNALIRETLTGNPSTEKEINMRTTTHILGLAIFMAFVPAAQSEEAEALERFEGLVIGMTEAELLAAFPDGTLTFADRNYRIEPRLGDFMRDGKRFEGGLMLVELRPEVADEREVCLAFHEEVSPVLVERYGEPDSAIRTVESDWAVIESNWAMSANGIIGILSRFVDAHGKCDAKIAFRGSNMEQF